MAWLWSSWQEFVEFVHPTMAHPGLFRLSKRLSFFEVESKLSDAVRDLTRTVEKLLELGFDENKKNRRSAAPEVLNKAKSVVIELIHAGEEMLLYHKRLAQSEAAYGFLHQNDLLEHWERYQAADRISMEIEQLVEDASELLAGYRELIEVDGRFIISEIDLPPRLTDDFHLARHLFSVGFDDVGVLIAGRGLEGVLRRIAKDRKIELIIKGKSTLACEADFYDIIETLYRVRWKVKGTRLITTEIRALLHYLRTLRNAGAHTDTHSQQAMVSPRETVVLVTKIANQLWKDVAGTRAQLDPMRIERNW